jgi:hypothetical protein
VDTFTMKAEHDGGVCPLCRCWLLAGDVLLIDQEVGWRGHKGCLESLGQPDRYPPLGGGLFTS